MQQYFNVWTELGDPNLVYTPALLTFVEDEAFTALVSSFAAGSHHARRLTALRLAVPGAPSR